MSEDKIPLNTADITMDNIGFYRGQVLLDVASVAKVRAEIDAIKNTQYGYDPFVCVGSRWVINPNYGNRFVYMLKRGGTIYTLMMMTVAEAANANAYILAKENAGMIESGKGWRWEMDMPL